MCYSTELTNGRFSICIKYVHFFFWLNNFCLTDDVFMCVLRRIRNFFNAYWGFSVEMKTFQRSNDSFSQLYRFSGVLGIRFIPLWFLFNLFLSIDQILAEPNKHV